MAYDIGPNLGALRLLALADHLETVPPERYDQTRWRWGCRMCALGHAVDLMGEAIGLRWVGEAGLEAIAVRTEAFGVFALAAEAFDMPMEDAGLMFGGTQLATCEFYGVEDARDITPRIAAARIRAYALERVRA